MIGHQPVNNLGNESCGTTQRLLTSSPILRCRTWYFALLRFGPTQPIQHMRSFWANAGVRVCHTLSQLAHQTFIDQAQSDDRPLRISVTASDAND